MHFQCDNIPAVKGTFLAVRGDVSPLKAVMDALLWHQFVHHSRTQVLHRTLVIRRKSVLQGCRWPLLCNFDTNQEVHLQELHEVNFKRSDRNEFWSEKTQVNHKLRVPWSKVSFPVATFPRCFGLFEKKFVLQNSARSSTEWQDTQIAIGVNHTLQRAENLCRRRAFRVKAHHIWIKSAGL